MPFSLTEEMLLDGEEDKDNVPLERELCQDGIEVRTEDEDAIEKQVRIAQRVIREITIECDKKLASAMRTSNPLRDEIFEVVNRQAKLASERIKTIIEQLSGNEQQPDPLGKDGKILDVAGLNSATELEQFLDRSIENEQRISEIRELLQCESETRSR
ncbi:unnamed protein product [Nippostrongylus brasiliensis]|uniref:Mediator of RNA polymerase II transcription subunit 11 n=1 Tax=Nippostrongylus brasiliensis TaxID=27835 RepID=A0A0N4Y100_NIPBR|nr:unnamed protein product [Nippostrongylus brasiliensis]